LAGAELGQQIGLKLDAGIELFGGCDEVGPAVLAPGIILVIAESVVILMFLAFMYLMRPTLSIVAWAAVRNT